MFKENFLSAIVVSIALIAAAVVIRPGLSGGVFQVVGYEGVVYRFHEKSGRIDVLVPTSEGALMMPVGQISAGMKDKMSDEERKQFSNFLKTVAQHLQIERAKSLGLKIVPADAVPEPEKK